MYALSNQYEPPAGVLLLEGDIERLDLPAFPVQHDHSGALQDFLSVLRREPPVDGPPNQACHGKLQLLMLVAQFVKVMVCPLKCALPKRRLFSQLTKLLRLDIKVQQLILGWPTIVLALAAFGLALLKGRSVLGFLGLAFAAPFLLYASHAPSGLGFSGGAFLMLGAAAELIRRGRRGWAAVLVAPFAAWMVILGVAPHGVS